MNDTGNVRVIHQAAEVAAARRDAYATFMRQLDGSGFTITDEARKRWWGVDYQTPAV